jgi:hypothetical protein
VLADLRAMRSTFAREHEEYLQVKATITPVVAGTGDAGLDRTLRAVMDAIAVMHQDLADRVEEHGQKLGKTADAYERSDIDAHGVFDDLMAEWSQQPDHQRGERHGGQLDRG